MGTAGPVIAGLPRLTAARHTVTSCGIGVADHALDKRFAAHWHEFYELFLIVGGRGRHVRNGHTEPVTAGSLGVVTPWDVHALEPAEGAVLQLVNVVFGSEAVSFRPGRGRTVRLSDEATGQVRADLARLAQELHQVRPQWRLAARATLDRVLVDAARVGAVASPGGPAGSPAGPAPGDGQLREAAVSPPIRRALLLLERDFAGELTLQDLAARVHLSPTHLSDRFHREVGVSFSAYRRGLRLRLAAAMLRHSDVPVAEVGRRSGYGNATHFSRAFRAALGCSPSEYRRREMEGGARAATASGPDRPASLDAWQDGGTAQAFA